MSKIYKAVGPPNVPDLKIEAVEPMREFTGEGWEDEYRAFYADQARLVVEALERSLPGGTLDALLARMMDRRASLLRVPLYGPPRGCSADR